MSRQGYLPDVNVLLALSEPGHVDHKRATRWFKQTGDGVFFLCPVTEASFVRLSANPLVGGREIDVAMAMLNQIAAMPNCMHLEMRDRWTVLVAPFASRIHGYRQVTDALLLGLAIRNKSILVTLDQHVQALAGTDFRSSVLTIA